MKKYVLLLLLVNFLVVSFGMDRLLDSRHMQLVEYIGCTATMFVGLCLLEGAVWWIGHIIVGMGGVAAEILEALPTLFVRVPSRRAPWVRYVIALALGLCWLPSHYARLGVQINDTPVLDMIIWFCGITAVGLVVGEICWRVSECFPVSGLRPMQQRRFN